MNHSERKPKKKEGGFSRRGLLIGAGAAVAGTVAAQAIGIVGGLASRSRERPGKFNETVAQVEGVPLRFVGVGHTLATFKHNETKIRAQVRKAPFVVLEYFDDDIRPMAVPGTEDKIENLPTMAEQFFASVGRVCAEERKDIIVVNPDTLSAELLDALLVFGIPMATILAAADAADRGDLSSLKILLGAGANIPSFLKWRSEVMRKLGGNASKDAWALDLQDWRDALTAQGMVVARRRYPAELQRKEMLAYHGAEHAPVLDYIADPKKREEKMTNYVLHNLLGDLSLRRYHFGKEKWEELERVRL